MDDIRDLIFKSVQDKLVTAELRCCTGGVVSGLEEARLRAETLGLDCFCEVTDGSEVEAGTRLMLMSGSPRGIVGAEEQVIGCVAKASGIATAAARAVKLAGPTCRVAAGATKKMPAEWKNMVRKALRHGGADCRIAEQPFLYLDKNYVAIFGGVGQTLRAVAGIEAAKVIQIKGLIDPLLSEAKAALELGASVIMVDTGNSEDAEAVLRYLDGTGRRGEVKLAFSGNIDLSSIPALAGMGIDILCIGRAIVDAPMLDLQLNVVKVGRRETGDTLNLINKTELWIEDVYASGVNLNDLAHSVADVLNQRREDVLVIDVRDSHISFDILNDEVREKDIVGKAEALLSALEKLPGVTLGPEVSIHSDGILGMVAFPAEGYEEMVRQRGAMVREISERLWKTARVFPSGSEVIAGEIEDTNSPYIKGALESLGFSVRIEAPLEDNENMVVNTLRNTVEDGCGLIFTTGGVGAEDKDFSVEGLLKLDPAAAAPWLVRFTKGTGRHKKGGVRIGVGEVANTLIVCLPGPNDEVRMAMDAVLPLLSEGKPSKYQVAERIAAVLRQKWQGMAAAHANG